MKRKMILLVLAISILVTFVPVMAQTNDDIRVRIVRPYERLNEQHSVQFDLRFYVQFTSPPFMQDGLIFVPLRDITNALGIAVHWDGEAQSITYVNNEGITYILVVGYDYAMSDTSTGDMQTIRLDTPPLIIDNRVFVPLQFLGESLGYYVYWDSDTRTAELTVWLTQYTPMASRTVWLALTGDQL